MNKYEKEKIMLVDLSVIFDQETGDYIAMLLERATPKKSIPRYKKIYTSDIEEYDSSDCPSCDLNLVDEYNFCPDCGQALDWSE